MTTETAKPRPEIGAVVRLPVGMFAPSRWTTKGRRYTLRLAVVREHLDGGACCLDFSIRGGGPPAWDLSASETARLKVVPQV